MESRKFLPLLVLAVLLGSCVIVWFYPPTGDFRVDNPFWNGLSDLNREAKLVPLTSLNGLPSIGEGTALIVVPYEQFSFSDLAQIRTYVSSGGTLVLLDDYGCGNQVLDGLGLDAKFSDVALLDPLFDYKNKNLPTITEFTNNSLSANLSSIAFNHPTYLESTGDLTIIAYSSSFSYGDVNSDGLYDSGEPTGHLPVAAYAKIGEGYVVTVSDPSLMINSMLSVNDNQQFLNNILSVQGGNMEVFVDQSHLPRTPLDDAKAGLAAVYGLVASPLGTLTLIVLLMALSFKLFWKRQN